MKSELLQMLEDGSIVSGQEIGRRLNMSRAAVWKHIESLRQQGHMIDVVSGKGYRLRHPHERWSHPRLSRLLAPHLSAEQIVVLTETASTNDVAMQCVKHESLQKLLVVAERQTAGRGRHGREWLSPPSGNIYASFAWCSESGISRLEGLSLVVGLSVAASLKTMGLAQVAVKWPNDLFLADAKLGGILIEVQAEAAGRCYIVAGLGLNVALPDDAQAILGRPVAALSSSMHAMPNRHDILATIMADLQSSLSLFDKKGFEAFRESWGGVDYLAGRVVTAHKNNQMISGTARGVDSSGALLIETQLGVVALNAGEVSLTKGSL